MLWNLQDGSTTVPVPSASMASPFMRPSLQLSNLSDESLDAEPEQPVEEVKALAQYAYSYVNVTVNRSFACRLSCDT